jgi:hypothetical protein
MACDAATKELASFVKFRGIQLKTISVRTDVSEDKVYRSLGTCTRALRADEYLSICAFVGYEPKPNVPNVSMNMMVPVSNMA